MLLASEWNQKPILSSTKAADLKGTLIILLISILKSLFECRMSLPKIFVPRTATQSHTPILMCRMICQDF